MNRGNPPGPEMVTGQAGDEPDRDAAPAPHHFVQLYESDAFLVDSVSTYVQSGLAAGEGVLVVATPAHRRDIQRNLKQQGIDVVAARKRGQYVTMDADGTLERFLCGDLPDSERFRQCVGTVVTAMEQQWPRVRVFGEIVALLWAAGRREGSLQLESLWNELATEHSFTLLCAYPLGAFRDAEGPALADVCDAHAHVLPSESYSEALPASKLRAVALLQEKSKQLESEIELRRSAQSELSDFLENALEGLHKVDAQGTILWANRAELDLLGYRANEYVGRNVAEFHVDPHTIREILDEVHGGRDVVNRPATLRCKDGSIRHVLLHSNGHFQGGKLVYSRCFTRDVTDLQAADRDRAMLAAIVQSSQDAIITKDMNGNIRSWNHAAERMFGYTEAEAVGKPITLIIPPDRIEEEREILARLRRRERIEHYETVRVTKDGRFIDISLTISPICDQSGNLVAASKVARDITGRKYAEAALRESEQRFGSFMESLPGLAWIKDAGGRYVYANAAVEQPFRISREQLLGRTDDELFTSETARQFKENDERALLSENGVRVVEALEHTDGIHYSIVSKFPIRDAGGDPRYIGGVAIDMTDRVRAEQALMESNRRKDEFLATLAHELRNPLAPIRNGLQILRMIGTTGAEAERVQEMMERQASHMVRLVDDLLDLSRITRGSIMLKRERMALSAVLEHALETSRPVIEAAAHTLDLELPEEPITVEGDPVRLSQIFANLLNNAAKYTNPGGRITVRVHARQQDVEVSVRDSGIGIPPEMLRRVFEMFAQIENPLRRSQDGLGIGLSLVRSLVAMHDGSVEARSEGIGRGSEFVVTLPLAGDASGERPGAVGRLQPTPFRGCRVLAVDDNKDSADSLGIMLRFFGADVHVVYDGASALDAIRLFRPRIVLMDLGMPDMSGFEAARQIRQDPQNDALVLVALTGWGQEEDRARSRDAGFDDHLVKPVDVGALQALFASVLR